MLKEIWCAQLNLHSPANVVIGRLDGEAYFCVQGTLFNDTHSAAGVGMYKSPGCLVWQADYHESDLNSGPGAYIHWIQGRGIEEPMILYAFVPDSDDRRGGARLLKARDGSLVREIENTTRFGNNNSVVADVDEDGELELVYADQRTLTCYELPSCRQRWFYDDGVLFCWSLPALIDINSDGRPEIVFGSEYNNADGSSSMIAIDCEGQQLWRSDGHAEDLGSTPVFFADIDGDGQKELLKVGLDLEHRQNQRWNHLHVFDTKGNLTSKIELGFTGIAIGDIDNDSHLEAVGLTNTRDGGNNGRREVRCIDLMSGKVKWTTPVTRAYLDNNSPIMADINGDGKLEVIVGTGNPAGYARLPDSQPWGDLYVINGNGEILQHQPLPGWPINFALCDVNDDGYSELTAVIDGTPGWLALYQTRAPAVRNDWPTPFASAARDGTMGAIPILNRMAQTSQ